MAKLRKIAYGSPSGNDALTARSGIEIGGIDRPMLVEDFTDLRFQPSLAAA